ncbi:unnamed protein product [Ceratitis capitata]|uniref:(Mediterranean fruit fly) hypothetical protein n=1 Tax=Ceratitis capitata TaxID=7213 RepID=A0A811V9S1_CERCA|nr:unnamed protein product [Ceratitis capitata]
MRKPCSLQWAKEPQAHFLPQELRRRFLLILKNNSHPVERRSGTVSSSIGSSRAADINVTTNTNNKTTIKTAVSAVTLAIFAGKLFTTSRYLPLQRHFAACRRRQQEVGRIPRQVLSM